MEKKEKNKCCKNDIKSTYRSDEEKKKICNRLNIIEGQIRGIKQMIADDRYCDDVLIQVVAACKSLQTLGNTILENHMKSCIVKEIQNGNTDILEDVVKIIKKLQ